MEDIKEVFTKKRNWKKIILIIIVVFFSLLLVLLGTSFALAHQYKNKIYPRVNTGDIDLGGLTKEQAETILQGKFISTFDEGIDFYYIDTLKTITDNNSEIFQINSRNVVEKAYEKGRKHHWLINQLMLLNVLANRSIEIDYWIDTEKLQETLNQEFVVQEKPARNAELKIKILDEATKTYEIEFIESQIGEGFDFDVALNTLNKNLKNFNNETIKLSSTKRQPEITTEIAKTKESSIKEIIDSIDNVIFTYETERWEAKWEDFIYWLELAHNSNSNEVIIQLNEETVIGQLEAIAQEIDQEAVDAKLQLKDNRVTEFEAHKNGLKLNQEESYQKIIDEVLNNKNTTIELVVEVTEPTVKMEEINDLGIKELLGSGWSDFSGSPSNRRHNIGIGAASLHGVLLAPGDEFSLIGTLGDIDGQNGYKPELVIKEGRTIAEFGGGLCQVGTTIFRATLQAGLQITQRRNHSYRVGYYEPAGTDATIYDPWPDYSFANNTDKHILIQTKMWGNNLVFELWGTSDGRKVTFEGQNTVENLRNLKPTIFNITGPGPAKEIETTELAPGEKRKLESAHNGADAIFYQTISKPGEEAQKITYKSHYVPWQEIWMVGIDPVKKEEEAQKELAEQAEAESNEEEQTKETKNTAEETTE